MSEPLFRMFSAKHHLNNNRWEPAADELAVYFTTNQLSGIFSKTLQVPSGTRAWLLVDNKVELLTEGGFTVENIAQRLNRLFQSKHAEVLITRDAALPLNFTLAESPCGDGLGVAADLRLAVRIGDVQRFRNHFMTQQGAVSTAQLEKLLQASVAQVVREYFLAYKLSELQMMQSGGLLRQEISALMQLKLIGRFSEYGLEFDPLDALEIHHQQTADEKREEEITRKHQEQQRAYREGKIKLEEKELTHELRAGEIALLKKIQEATSEEEAIKLAGVDALDSLKHEYLQKRKLRENALKIDERKEADETVEWQQLQKLAKIRHDGEVRSAEIQKDATEEIERQKVKINIDKIKIQGELEVAKLIEDEDLRKVEIAIKTDLLINMQLREENLKNIQNKADIDVISLTMENRRIHAQLENALAKAEVEEKIRKMDADGNIANYIRLQDVADASYREKALLEVEIEKQRSKQERKRKKTEHKLQIATKIAEARIAAEQNKQKIDYAITIGSLPPLAQIALQNSPEIAEIISGAILKNQDFSKMSAEEIKEILSSVSKNSINGMNSTAEGIVNALKDISSVFRSNLQNKSDNEESKTNAKLYEKHINDLMTIITSTQTTSIQMGQQTADVGIAAAGARVAAGHNNNMIPPEPAQQTPRYTSNYTNNSRGRIDTKYCSTCRIEYESDQFKCDICNRSL